MCPIKFNHNEILPPLKFSPVKISDIKILSCTASWMVHPIDFSPPEMLFYPGPRQVHPIKFQQVKFYFIQLQ